jgi:DNA (cytosine-5)-methyltransferase 1
VALHPPADDLAAISLCTGSGALDLALELAIPSLRPILYVEREAFAVATLVQAIEAAYLAPAPIWSDTGTLRGRRFRGCVDLLYGGIPCQPHSEAGPARGADDARDCWPDARRIIVQSRPWAVFIENVGGMLATGGAFAVHRGLRRLGYQVTGGLFTAAEVGGSHERERLFILAVSDALADADRARPPQRERLGGDPQPQQPPVIGGGRAMGNADGESWGEGRGFAGFGPGIDRPTGASGEMGDPDRGGYRGGPGDQIGGAERGEADTWSSPYLAFPPGPGDADRWAAVLATWPHLEPVICGKPHELSARVDRARDWTQHARALRLDRLRLLGGGVVPLEAAYAFRALAVELARTSSGATRLVRLMGANRSATGCIRAGDKAELAM